MHGAWLGWFAFKRKVTRGNERTKRSTLSRGIFLARTPGGSILHAVAAVVDAAAAGHCPERRSWAGRHASFEQLVFSFPVENAVPRVAAQTRATSTERELLKAAVHTTGRPTHFVDAPRQQCTASLAIWRFLWHCCLLSRPFPFRGGRFL